MFFIGQEMWVIFIYGNNVNRVLYLAIRQKSFTNTFVVMSIVSLPAVLRVIVTTDDFHLCSSFG